MLFGTQSPSLFPLHHSKLYDPTYQAPLSLWFTKMATMKALGYKAYGDENQMNLFDVPKPSYGDNDVLVKLSGFAVNPVRITRCQYHNPILMTWRCRTKLN